MSATSVTMAPPVLTRLPRWVWVVILVLALISRLAALGSWPLAPDEAWRALAALDAARGEGWPLATDSPLLLVGNALLFSLFGAGDALARLIPALAGVVLVMLPYLWHRVLGEIGAIAASVLLLVSPLALFSSRQLSPATPGVAAAGLLITLLVLDTHEGVRRPALLAALALGLGLVAGPAFYDALVPGLLLGWVLSRGLWARAVRWRWAWPAGLLIGVLIAVGLGFRWSGWAGIADGIAAWLTSWGLAREGSFSLGLLPLYEPALLILGVAGVVLALRHRSEAHQPFWYLLVWAAAVALLIVARPNGIADRLVAVVLPLALLGGWVVTALVRDIAAVELKWVGLHTLAAFLLWLPAVLTLMQHARGLAYVEQMGFVVAGVLVFFALQGLLIFLFSLVLRPGLLWRSALAGFVSIMSVLQLSFATGLGYVRAGSPLEPAVVTTGSRDLWHLQALARELAVLRDEREDAVPIALVDRDDDVTAVVRWALRDFDELMVVASWPDTSDMLVITPEAVALEQPSDADQWRGMRFIAVSSHDAPVPGCQTLWPPTCSDPLRWYFYRESPYAAWSKSVILWQVREPL